jgi:hypothetical protein
MQLFMRKVQKAIDERSGIHQSELYFVVIVHYTLKSKITTHTFIEIMTRYHERRMHSRHGDF